MAATRQASDADHPIVLGKNNWKEYAARHRSVILSEKLDKLLGWAASQSDYQGKPFRIDADYDFPVCDAIGPEQFLFVLRHLQSVGLINLGPNNENLITVKGWNQLSAMQAVGGEPGRCFVAMWFDDALDAAYLEAIEPAAKENGFTAYRVKEDLFNGDITDQILAEIRKARFVIADCTGHRNGVYYEAGFARGLGRPVIMACRDDHFSQAHFDTNHLNYVVWKGPDDLRRKLSDRIKATIIPAR